MHAKEVEASERRVNLDLGSKEFARIRRQIPEIIDDIKIVMNVDADGAVGAPQFEVTLKSGVSEERRRAILHKVAQSIIVFREKAPASPNTGIVFNMG